MSNTTGEEELDPLEQDSLDPFSERNYRVIQFTQLSRIYDTLLTLVQIQNPVAAEKLMAAHSEGYILSASPQYVGEFLHDNVNDNVNDSVDDNVDADTQQP